MDSGDFAGAASLFEHARLHVGGGSMVDAAIMLTLCESAVTRYPDGTPRTKHVVTNPIIDVEDDAGTATCRSCYPVLQQTGDFAPQPVVAGRYHNRFQRVDGEWRFVFRDYSMMDTIGDVSHLRGPIEPTR